MSLNKVESKTTKYVSQQSRKQNNKICLSNKRTISLRSDLHWQV